MRFVYGLGILILLVLMFRPKSKPVLVPEEEANTPVTQESTQKSKEETVYAALREKCVEKHLKYRIYCFDNSGCNAHAWDENLTYEQGTAYGTHSWVGHESGPTEAAQNLLSVLNGEPNHNPERTDYTSKQTYDSDVIKP